MAATFSISLRKQPIWPTLGPTLATSAAWKFKESSSTTHSLTLPLTLSSRPIHNKTNVHPIPSLHVLLLTPSDLTATSLPATEARVSAFNSSLPDVLRYHKLVVLIQCTTSSGNQENPSDANDPNKSAPRGLNAFLALQTLIFSTTSLSLPLLPTSSPTTLLLTLQTYISTVNTTSSVPSSPHQPSPPSNQPSLAESLDLLAYITSSLPMPLPQHAVNVLSDLFPNLRQLEQACRSEAGKRVLREYLGDEVTKNVIGFWEEEWLIS